MWNLIIGYCLLTCNTASVVEFEFNEISDYNYTQLSDSFMRE